jgi:hypothetical protein
VGDMPCLSAAAIVNAAVTDAAFAVATTKGLVGNSPWPGPAANVAWQDMQTVIHSSYEGLARN